MKKLLIALGLLISTTIQAQKVERDYFENEMHKVETEWEEVEDDNDKRDFFVMLHAAKAGDTTLYYISFQLYSYGSFNFELGSKLLMKTTTDSILTKECVRVVPTQKQVTVIFMVPTIRYYSTVTYKVSEEELNMFANEGIKKLRFQVTGETFEKEYKKDQIGKYLKKAKQNIDKALSKQKSFESDF